MNDLVIMENKQAVTTSLQVAETFEKRHDHLLRDIENLKEDIPNFGEMFFLTLTKDSYGRDRKSYLLNRDGFTLLAMGFTGKKALEFKLLYITAFNEMEQTITQSQLTIPQNPMEALQLMFDAHKDLNTEVTDIKDRVVNIEENAKLDAGEYSYITKRVNQRVAEVAKGYGRLTPEQRGKLFKDINNGINQIANTRTRTQLKQKDFENVCEFINDWEPSTATKTIIRQMTLDLEGEVN